jgi:outer membrane immunogenic protein
MCRVLVVAAAICAPCLAVAADQKPYRLSVSAAPLTGAFDWTGFYLGVHGGWGAARAEKHVPRGAFTHTYDAPGFLAGGHAGYLHQWGWFVAGLEADAAWSELSGDDDGFAFTVDETEVEWMAGALLRAGMALDRVLLYGTGGVAAAGVEQINTDQGGWSDGRTFYGWSIGGGAELALTPHLTAAVEYRFTEFEEEGFVPTTTVFPFTLDAEVRQVRAKVSYRF